MIKQAAAIVVAATLTSGAAIGAEYEVGQKNKAFTKEKLEIKVGDTVNFPNMDPIHHNVFSLSEVKPFDLGSYEQGDSKAVVFDKAGTVEVECALHPSMHMVIEVKE
jgi:plastocyanin